MHYLDAACFCETLCKALKSSKINKTIKHVKYKLNKRTTPELVNRSSNQQPDGKHAYLKANNLSFSYSRQPDFVYPTCNGIIGCQKLKAIASGGYGKVYLIKMVTLQKDQHAALKVFDIFWHDNTFECEKEKAVLKYVAMHEKYTGKQLQIAHVRDDIQGVHCPNLMLEDIQGFDLWNTVLQQYEFSALVDFVRNMMDQIGFGVLNDLHSMNVYHNDIKPNNIMYDPGKNLFYLIDFGLAVPLSLLNQSKFSTASFLTTVTFMSPWHLKLVHGSRYFADGKIKWRQLNTHETRVYAINADFYSLALTALTILGKRCSGDDPLCVMTKQILALQSNYFAGVDERGFGRLDIRVLEKLFDPFWQRVNTMLREYITLYRSPIISTLFNWLQSSNDRGLDVIC